MSLATRCPSCGTAFRVVQDQLKVSGGWVRCGHCQDVFNALESLFDLAPEPRHRATDPLSSSAPASPSPAEPTPDADAPAPAPGPATAWVADPVTPVAVPVAGDAYMPAPEPRPSPEQALASQAVPWTASEPDPIPPVPAEEAPREAVAPTPLPQAAVPQDTPPNADPARSASLPPERAPDAVPWAGATPQWTGIRRRRRPPPASTPAPSAPSRLAAEATTHPSLFAADSRLPALVLAPVATPPSFVQRAERAARWQSPAWRAGLATTALLLWLALGVQASLFNRNLLASRWPVLQPALTALCAPLACEVGAPSMIDQWVLNSSRLARTPRADVLQLVAELHNHADLALRKPALDVSFTDASGQLIARKVLLPTQLGDPQVASVAANAPWTVDLRLQTPSLNITGFTIEVFYP